ncbi:hypothetical protein PPYR_03774 [Photinus pyralis]|uniref:Tubulin--tyrosine ligase-like protein 12 SET-like domain-containing protein n=1 Tax=Photinus pyralis TaxID=7054 RepID=A0A1Y1KN27_PHOPY|nr:tubulin--tyrosine ligase-like protein 12 [Photinus pyralis]KAB0801588.1 hypothetical protein PPYR_03774 [Photinus pyralis]
MDFDTFKQLHEQQLNSSMIPKHFVKVLHEKLEKQVFDAGNAFTLLRVDDQDMRDKDFVPWVLQLHLEDGIKANDPSNIYLIDHAWTFEVKNARKQLQTLTELRRRVASITGVEETENEEEMCEQIFDEIWKYGNFYWAQTNNVEDKIPIWYLLDEVGSAVHHSGNANCRIVPFLHLHDNSMYSVMFPTRDIDCGEIITRNFMENVDKKDYDALVLPWVTKSFVDVSYEHEGPDPDYFLSGHIKESLPILSSIQTQKVKTNYKVFSEYSLLSEYLTDEHFSIVDNAEDADILWQLEHFKNFEELSLTNKFVNQFPFEYVLNNKDLLAIICAYNSVAYPRWLPITYNLKTELTPFVSYFLNREKEGLDNHWIVKPVNLARSLDTYITNNINCIVRLSQTGTKIVQKYVDRPVLFYRPDSLGKVKFDVRYVILLKGVKPLEMYVHKHFFLRFANNPFILQHFDDYETHFTVMNYTNNGQNLKHMVYNDFLREWAEQYAMWPWEEVEKTILCMLKEVFNCALKMDPPCGISESPQSRALYAADIILEWSDDKIQPKLLEVNWMPDCERACRYDPNFFNDIFKLLFCDMYNPVLFHDLKTY